MCFIVWFVPGLKSPDVVLYESLKLLCSLLVTLVGNGLYGAYSSSTENHFIDQGTDACLSIYRPGRFLFLFLPYGFLSLKILKNFR